MKWGNWELVVSQHPPILRNACWQKDIAIEDNIHVFFTWIMKARSCELSGLNTDTLGLVDAISSIIAHCLTLDGNVSFPLGAYSYAASLQSSGPEIKSAIAENEPAATENEQEKFMRRARERAASTRHPDQGKGNKGNNWPWS